jgi:hypothetical protein
MTGAEADLGLREEYEAAVRALRAEVEAMRCSGIASEEIARMAHAGRRRLAAYFKERTPEPLRSAIYQRTVAAYGDPLGPSVETLRAKGRSWEEIAESATRPGRVALEGNRLVFPGDVAG